MKLDVGHEDICYTNLRDFRLAPRCKRDIRSSAMLRSINFVISDRRFGVHFVPIFKDKAV